MFATLFRPVLLAGLCAAGAAQAQLVCPPPATSIASGNAAALKLFQERAVKPAQAGTALKSRPQGMQTAEAFGAKGDGAADDTRALQEALSKHQNVWLEPGRVYRITRRLELGTGSGLVSDGTATLLMAAGRGSFDNTVARRNDSALYNEHGAGLRVSGDKVTLSDLFIVKEYVDGQYVIGIDVVGASNVAIRRVRLRGFSLAPGIITIRSSDNVEVAGSLLHGSCTQFPEVPPDVASYQITGISVDDTRVGGRGSTSVKIVNNVIADLHMVRVTKRNDQSDGINFAAPQTGRGSVIADNDIQGQDEGIDLFGGGIEVRGNRVRGGSSALKLIHGARDIVVTDNTLIAGPGGQAINLFRAYQDEEARRVQNVRIERNVMDMTAGGKGGVIVEQEGKYPPTGITLRQNKFLMGECRLPAIHCDARQCQQGDNQKVQARGGAACPDGASGGSAPAAGPVPAPAPANTGTGSGAEARRRAAGGW